VLEVAYSTLWKAGRPFCVPVWRTRVARAPVRTVRFGRARNGWMYALFESLRLPMSTLDCVQPMPSGLPPFMSCRYGNSASCFVTPIT
jgi:hypothetical protein